MRRIERATAFKRDYRKAEAISRYRDLDERLIALLELLVTDRSNPAPEPRPCLVRKLARLSRPPSLARPPTYLCQAFA
jgi:hypothetical protein